MRTRRIWLAFSICSAIFLAACQSGSAVRDLNSGGAGDETAARIPAGWTVAGFVDRENAPAGSVAFIETPYGGLLMRVDLKGLAEGWHGLHLHEVADCSDYEAGFKASGGHIDPENREHGLLNPDGWEVADMPNIYAGADGRATAEISNPLALLRRPEPDVDHPSGKARLLDEDGFAVIVHAQSDDHLTQPVGGAGERIACAAIRSAF